MKTLKSILTLLFLFVLMASFSQCATTNSLQKTAPVEILEPYAQKWVAGVQGGGSGINVFIPVKDNSIPLDSMFFRGQKIKMEYSNDSSPLYVGRFKTAFNQPRDLILSSDMKEESKNRLPITKQEKWPFELNEDECVISYQKEGKTLYYKISNIRIDQPIHYPSAPGNGR